MKAKGLFVALATWCVGCSDAPTSEVMVGTSGPGEGAETANAATSDAAGSSSTAAPTSTSTGHDGGSDSSSSESTGVDDPPASCEDAASQGLRECFATVAEATMGCYAEAGEACSPGRFDTALGQLRETVEGWCSDNEVADLGYGAQMNVDALVGRLDEVCVGQAVSLAARTFGGPHAAALSGTPSPAAVTCLMEEYATNAEFIVAALDVRRTCLLDASECDTRAVAVDIALEAQAAAEAISAACPGALLTQLSGQSPSEAVELSRRESECMTSAAHGDTSALPLLCGAGLLPGVTTVRTEPEGLEPLSPGVPTQLMLDESVWGTRCGDGSPYHFWIEMPPPGGSAQQVHAFVQGGGACFSADCLAADSERFRSDDEDYQAQGVLNPGGLEAQADVDPMTDGIKANFEYCTQDFHIGVSTTQDIVGLTVHRYGGNNLRAGLQVLRNLVAAHRNDQSERGYRPDDLEVLFSGNSAGGLAVGFHLHHVIDQLRWRDTLTAAAAGTSVNEALIGGIGPIIEGWDARRVLPPYCLAPTCFIPGAALYQAHAQRLLATPGQQLLVAHNQVDDTQQESQLFLDQGAHINALRQSFCDSHEAPGVQWFLGARVQDAHSIFSDDGLYFDIAADGVALSAWVHQARTEPESVVDRVSEGALASSIGGVEPFPCAIR